MVTQEESTFDEIAIDAALKSKLQDQGVRQSWESNGPKPPNGKPLPPKERPQIRGFLIAVIRFSAVQTAFSIFNHQTFNGAGWLGLVTYNVPRCENRPTSPPLSVFEADEEDLAELYNESITSLIFTTFR